MNEAIEKAAEYFGSATRLARAVGVSQPSVVKWKNGGGMDVRHAVKIEDLTEG